MPLISVSATDEESIRSILGELSHESDRAAGIVGAVLVEDSLTTLVKSRLLPNDDLHQELFRASGPLGAFSVKINVAHLMGLFSPAAREELDTIRKIRNEFAHRVARSFSFERIRDLANNLSLSEKVEFHIAPRESGQAVLFIGAKPDEPSEPVLPLIDLDKLTPRERYMRACQFYAGALLLTANAMPKTFQAVYF